MKFELHCLYWENANPEFVRLHQACMAHLGVDVIYTRQTIRHDFWIDGLARERLDSCDAIGFIDIDCVPYAAASVIAACDYALNAGSFIGLAQSANHLQPTLPVYAAPAFMVISRAGYQQLGRPSLKNGAHIDAAQDLSLTADVNGFAYRVLYPRGFNALPEGGAWRLGNYGFYGIGTEYEGGFFHLFQSNRSVSVELFGAKVAAIMAGEPQPTRCPYASTSFELEGSQSVVQGRRRRRFARKLVRLL